MATLATSVVNWADACAVSIIANNVTVGLVNQYGQPMSAFTKYTWGVDNPTCYEYCGKDKIHQVFNFDSFAADFTSWLLPMLALTAQLPFQAKNSRGNLMSLCMAVGSPAMITYSLTITILNRNWVRQKFQKLRKELNSLRDQNLRRLIRDRLQAAQYVLQESQQVPMRASQAGGWLSSLITLEENNAWWKRVMKDLQNSRRGYTFAMVAQIGMALIAYTFTIAITLTSFPSATSQGLNIESTAGGGLWIWMIPVIWGWIMCGTQDRPHSITEALEDDIAPAFRINEEGKLENVDTQHGVCSRSGLTRKHFTTLRYPSTTEDKNNSIRNDRILSEATVDAAEDINTASDENVEETARASTITTSNQVSSLRTLSKEDCEMIYVPSWFGFSIEGDEALEGPIFNYARIFTFREFSSTITKFFHGYISGIAFNRTQPNDLLEIAESCGLDERPLRAYTPWRETDPSLWHHILIACFAAIFLQWGTTGPAIMMAYLTPEVGLGCRSGSHLIYGILATFSWVLLACSSLLSHATSLRYQEIYAGTTHSRTNDPEDPIIVQELLSRHDAFTHSSTLDINLTKHNPSKSHTTLKILTITTRLLGKSIAVINACWIVIAAIFEYTGVFSSCWCATNSTVRGNRGWVLLFATEESLRDVAKGYWVSGVIFSFGVGFVACVGFGLGSRRSERVE